MGRWTHFPRYQVTALGGRNPPVNTKGQLYWVFMLLWCLSLKAVEYTVDMPVMTCFPSDNTPYYYILRSPKKVQVFSFPIASASTSRMPPTRYTNLAAVSPLGEICTVGAFQSTCINAICVNQVLLGNKASFNYFIWLLFYKIHLNDWNVVSALS